MAWLPGVSPNRASTLVDALRAHIDLLKGETSIPALAHTNLLAAAFELLDPNMDAELWCEWIVDFSRSFDRIAPEEVLREINEDRSISGFPEVKGTEQIEVELRERRRYYTDTIKTTLDSFETMKLVEVITAVVEQTTDAGECHAPQLVHELVDRYEIEANHYLQPEAGNISKLIDAIREAAQHGEAAVAPLMDRLEDLVRKWDAIAQPIQLSMKAQGLDHDLSHEVAWGIRGLAVDLFNKHDMLGTATRLNKTLQELFAELPSVVERLDEDSEALEDIEEKRKAAQQNEAASAREISYEAEIGVVFKDKLKISPNGVEWQGRKMALADISSVRWGAVSRSVNGIPTGTDYTMAVGDNRSELVIETRKGDIYSTFTDCLWKAVCSRLMTETLVRLRSGQPISFGSTVIDDKGIHLTKHKFLGSDPAYREWGQVTYGSANGSLNITAQDDKKIYASIPYLTTPNAHILEAIIRLNFKSWKGKLSGLLSD